MIAKPYQVEQVLLAIEKLEDDHVFENDRYTYRSIFAITLDNLLQKKYTQVSYFRRQRQ